MSSSSRESDGLAADHAALHRRVAELEQELQRITALREREKVLSATLRSIGDGIIACDCEGKVTSLNRAAETLTGWTTAEAAGRPLEEVCRIIHAQTRETAENPVARALAEGVNVDLANHTALISKDGAEQQITNSLALIRDASGAVTGAVLVFRAVTEECWLEELRESEDRLSRAVAGTGAGVWDWDMADKQQKTILDHLSVGMIVVNDENKVHYINRALVELYGISDAPLDIAGISASEFIARYRSHYLNPEDTIAKFKQLVANNVSEFGWEVLLRNGRILTVDFVVLPMGRMWVHRDITELKRAEEKLRASEERFRSLQEYTLDRFAILKPWRNEQGEIVDFVINYIYQNITASKIAGRNTEELVGRRMTEISPAFPRTSFFQRYKQVVETGQGTTFEDHYSVGGVDEWFRAMVTPIPDGIAISTQIITERKRMQKALQESEHRYSVLFEKSATPAILFKLPEVVIADANYATQELTGYTRQEMVGKNSVELGMIQHAEWEQTVSRFRKDGSIHACELQITTKSGHNKTVVLNLNTLLAGEQDFALTTIYDITERRRAEESLRESEAKYRMLFENMNAGFVLHEMIYDEGGKPVDYRFLELNPMVEKLTGSKADMFLGHTIKELMSDNDQYWIDTFGKVVQTGESITYQNYAKELGKYFDTFVFSPQKDQFAMFFVDITERKQAEEALRESELRFAIAIEGTGAGIWDWNMVKNEVVFSVQWKKMLGYEDNEIENSLDGWKKLWHPDDAVRIEKAVSDHIAGYTDNYEVIHRCRHKDGSWRWLITRGKMLKDSSGKPYRWIGTNIDITEIKRAEETQQKYEQQLQLNQKLESLGVLAGGIAHDFNNLMGGIFGYIELANEVSKEANVISYLSEAMNTIDRARALTQQLLTFAKGGTPIQQIGDLFPMIEESARFALSGANVSCHFDIPKDLWACNFDKNQISQVISNLIINAQQAMPVGGTIELTARNITLAEKEHPILKKSDYVKVSIKDCGIGIPKEMIGKIFDPFFTTKEKGHGLGLAISYSIINRHGGCIDVESEPGKGSTFKVYLPASSETALAAEKETDKAHKGSGIFLIMDDEEVIRNILEVMLRAFGYTVISKENGKDAIEFFTRETTAHRTIAGMIFDLTVPGGMGGRAAIEEIRKTNTDIPAFVASGYADDPVIRNPSEYGFTASICKPFRKSELSEMLNRYIHPKI